MGNVLRMANRYLIHLAVSRFPLEAVSMSGLTDEVSARNLELSLWFIGNPVKKEVRVDRRAKRNGWEQKTIE